MIPWKYVPKYSMIDRLPYRALYLTVSFFRINPRLSVESNELMLKFQDAAALCADETKIEQKATKIKPESKETKNEADPKGGLISEDILTLVTLPNIKCQISPLL